MSFKKSDVDELLAATGRRCCLCGRQHRVQVHHIVAKEDGGTDDIDNAIPLCPNCHDEVHSGYTSGRTTRAYTPDELKRHRTRTIELAQKAAEWSPGSSLWEEDRDLILFYAQALDRSAFRTHFHEEMSFADFDQAMEDTLLALNTGYWRTRDGTVLGRSKGKVNLINEEWHRKMDDVVHHIENIRSRFRQALGLDEMLFRLGRGRRYEFEEMLERRFRNDFELSQWMDSERQAALDIINSILEEIGQSSLRGIGHW